MLAVALCVGLFCYWTAVGYAVTSALHVGRSRLQKLLLAPTIGLAVSVICLFGLSRLGLPVAAFGIPLAIVILLGATVLLWRTRPGLDWRRAWPYGLVLGFALVATARPMVKYGFDWVSYCNDDMANYALAADWFYHHGYYDLPRADQIIEGRHYSADYWFLYHGMKSRAGCELVLAWVSRCTGLTGHQVFMPVILAFHLGLLLAAAALAANPGLDKGARRGVSPESAEADDGDGTLIPSPPYSGEKRAELATARERVGVRGRVPDQHGRSISAARATPLTPALSPEYRGEGVSVLPATGVTDVPEGPSGEAPERELRSPAAVASGNEPRPSTVAHFRQTVINVGTLTAALLAFSPLTALGTLYQLIAQVSGLTLLAATAALVMRPWQSVSDAGRWHVVRHGVLAGIVGAGLLVIYPEVCPFLALGVAGYFGVGLLRRRLNFGRFSLVLGVAALIAVVLLQRYAIDAVRFLALQSQTAAPPGGSNPQAILFPYYLIPEGLANLWGLLRVAEWEGVTDMSTRIAVGGVLLVLASAAIVWLCWRGRPVAFLAAVMLGLGVVLFRRDAGFGLFKLAMFIQPFLLGSVVVAWLMLTRRRRRDRFGLITAVRLAPLVALGAAMYPSLRGYVDTSYGTGIGFTEIRDPSGSRVAAEFRQLVAGHPSAQVIVSDAYNMVLAKFQALYTRGRELIFPSRQYFTMIDRAAMDTGWRYLDPARAEMAAAMREQRYRALYPLVGFDVKDPADPGLRDKFYQSDLGRTALRGPSASRPGPGDMLLIESGPRQSIFNRRTFPGPATANFAAVPYDQARNHLIFIVSDLGYPYYVYGGREMARAVYQIEPEPSLFAESTMAGVGRYLLMEVINPTPEVRLAVTMTCSYLGDGENQLPPHMAAVGAERLPFPVAGRGSMRVFSPPLRPQMIDGRAYVLIDMGADGGWLGPKRTGLTKLYGRELSVERRLVGFARDISLVSESEYQSLAPPSRVEGFTPARSNPLRNADLEYSGMYEDGWLSPDTYFRLTQPAGADEAAIKVNVPDGIAPGFQTELTWTVDGAEVWQGTIGPGELALRRPIPSSAAPRVREMRLRFSRPLHLPAPDGRPVAAILVSAGFEPKPAPPSRIEGFTPDDRNPLRQANLPHAGIDEDGWVAADGYVRLTQPARADEIVLKGVVPGGLTPDFKTELTVQVDGREVWRETIGPGEFTIRRPAPLRGSPEAHAPREVRLRFSATQRLPAPDGRSVGARLYVIGFEQAAASQPASQPASP